MIIAVIAVRTTERGIFAEQFVSKVLEKEHLTSLREQLRDAAGALDLDLVELIARTLKDALPSVPTDLALRCAEKIVIALYRERYLPEHAL